MVIVGILALLIFASIVYSGFTERTTQLSAYSDKWNDMSEYRSDIQKAGYNTASIVSSPTMLAEIDDPGSALFIAVGIERAYTITEARTIYEFVQKGGTAIIADDYGFANSLSEFYFKVEFIGHRLWDAEYERNPQFIKIYIDPTSTAIFNFDGNIMMNNPTALKSGSGKVAMSTNLSWVDMDDDEAQSIDEISQPHPVIVEKELDEGKIIFISDSSVFINDMWGRADNARFGVELVQYLLESGGTVIFDESRHIRENPVDSARQSGYEALVILTTDESLRWLTAIIAILILGLLVISYDDPVVLRHTYNIGAFKLRELRDPWLGPKDTDRVRYVFLERVRIHLGLSLEEFRDLTRTELEELIDDRNLAAFALDLSKMYSGTDLADIFKRVENWPIATEPETEN
jgi:hypothetical protein